MVTDWLELRLLVLLHMSTVTPHSIAMPFAGTPMAAPRSFGHDDSDQASGKTAERQIRGGAHEVLVQG